MLVQIALQVFNFFLKAEFIFSSQKINIKFLSNITLNELQENSYHLIYFLTNISRLWNCEIFYNFTIFLCNNKIIKFDFSKRALNPSFSPQLYNYLFRSVSFSDSVFKATKRHIIFIQSSNYKLFPLKWKKTPFLIWP